MAAIFHEATPCFIDFEIGIYVDPNTHPINISGIERKTNLLNTAVKVELSGKIGTNP